VSYFPGLGVVFNDLPSYRAWIGSIQYSLVFLPGLVTGRYFDLGYFRSIFLTSSALLVGATFLVAQCTEYWQFLLCQGFAVGVRKFLFASSAVVYLSHSARMRWYLWPNDCSYRSLVQKASRTGYGLRRCWVFHRRYCPPYRCEKSHPPCRVRLFAKFRVVLLKGFSVSDGQCGYLDSYFSQSSV